MTVGWVTDTVTPDLSRALHYTLLWGFDGLVLRTVGSGRVPFVNEGALRRRLEADDVPVLAVDPGLFEGDVSARATWMNELASFDDTAAFCARLSVPRVRAGALAASAEGYDEAAAADALRQLGDLAERAGVAIAVRNEADSAVATGAALASLLGTVAHASVQADWRPFDALQAGESPEAGLAALLSTCEIATLTVRDQTAGGGPAAPGEGRVDWDAQVRALGAEWEGAVVLEVLGRPAGSFGLRAASAAISTVRRARRADRP